VTGSTTGTGFATALTVAKKGGRVLLLNRYVHPSQVYVNPSQVCVNPSQVYVNPTQVYANPS
jgi:NAD(P)-dependent dehydrogenase (short-subunit alcohol dehydrogenase family)